jgi:hypothetical protein
MAFRCGYETNQLSRLGDAATMEYQRVSVTGTFLHDQGTVVFASTRWLLRVWSRNASSPPDHHTRGVYKHGMPLALLPAHVD